MTTLATESLCRELGATHPNWPKTGVACRDPETQRVWRKHGTGWYCPGVGWCDDNGIDGKQFHASVQRGITNGPEPDDVASIGALLLSMKHIGVTQDAHGDLWLYGHMGTADTGNVPKLDELAIRAAISQKASK